MIAAEARKHARPEEQKPGNNAKGYLLWSYTSRPALTTASASSNRMYSELWTNICLAVSTILLLVQRLP